VVVFVPQAPAAAIELAGLDPGLGAVIGAGVMLIAAGVFLRWLIAAGGRARRGPVDAEGEAAVAARVARAGPDEHSPERPGCRRTLTAPWGFSELPRPEGVAGDPGRPPNRRSLEPPSR
jgi:hypothetical protein